MPDNLCSKCGSNEIIRDAEIRDYDASSYRRLSIHVPLRKPEGGFFQKTTESSELRARVCGQCGYTELYATNHEAILKATK
jgi:predicted nucleic-acid-binding Zn-ribbon protein